LNHERARGISVPLVDVEFVLRLSEEDFAGVIVGEQFAADDSDFAAVGFAEQHPCFIVALPAKQDGAAAFLEQQQGRHGDRRNFFQFALQHPTLQAGASRRAGQQLDTQTLFGQR
jgi:hypothetical protein